MKPEYGSELSRVPASGVHSERQPIKNMSVTLSRRKSFQHIATIVLTCSLLTVWVRTSEACGPFSLSAIFTYAKHPDMPLEPFVQGNIGVVQPSYARSYLYAAYRQMAGVKFDDKEQAALIALWKERLDGGSGPSEADSIKPWRDARATIPGMTAEPRIGLYRSREKPNDYESYLNCQDDAFVTAANTLNDLSSDMAPTVRTLKIGSRHRMLSFPTVPKAETSRLR